MSQESSKAGSVAVATFGVVFGAIAVVMAAAALVLAVGADGGAAAAPDGAVAAGSAEPVALVESEVFVELKEFSIEGDLTVPAGNVTFVIGNGGSTEHNLVLSTGDRSGNIAPGGSENLDVDGLTLGSYAVICDIPGHEAAGMTTTLNVVPATSGAAVSAEGDAAGDDMEDMTDEEMAAHEHGGEDTDWAALDTAMMESMLAFPAETEGKGNAPLEPTVLPDGTKEFELTAKIVEWEIEPGRFVEAWTYNGIVPGPQIRVDLGDRVRIIVHNELPMGTDVHWHGISTPFAMDGVAPYTQELIYSGEDFVYEFDAEEPAVGMYHAHHHGQMQVTNGMFGPFIIGDTPIPYGRTISGETIPDEIELAAEIPMVLNDAGTIGFSLNGKSFPATEPLVVGEDDWFVVHYYNEGLGAHPMHLHQFEQLIFAKDGIPLDEPYFADTINIAPGERYSVLVKADRAGTWVWHCHILTHVERETGMFGMVTAVVVEPSEAG